MKTILKINFILVLFAVSSFGQEFKLNRNKQIDTLFVWLDNTSITPVDKRIEFSKQFDSIVLNFNKQKHSFLLKIDSSSKSNSIIIKMGDIRYVTWKRSVLMTGVDLALIGANFLIFPDMPIIIPFYLLPVTWCKITVLSSHEFILNKPKFFVNPNGYFKKKSNQEKRFSKKFDKTFTRFFERLNVQYMKMHKVH